MAIPARMGGERPVATRWDPFREIEDAWARMGSLLGDVAGGATGGVLRGPLMTLATLAAPVDIEELDDAFVVELDLPGVRKEDVSIDLRDNELMIKGEMKERERKGVLRRQTRRYGAFEHRISVPGDVDPDSVSAMLENGILTVRLAKARRSQPKHIEIKEVNGS